MRAGTPRHALLLTAGLGTRLHPLTAVRAKPAVPVAGEPLVRRIIAWLVGRGVTDLVLNLHHRPETVTAVVGDGVELGARVRYSWEQPEVLGSAGGPRQAAPIIGADPFFIVNGDTLTDVDLHGLARAHAAAGALVTLALAPNREPERYGGVRLDGDGRVTGFVRRGPAAAGSFHFVGVQVARGDAFAALPCGQVAASIGGVYDELLARRPGAIAGFVSEPAFWEIGTVADYWSTSRAFIARDSSPRTWRGRDTHIDRTARVTRSIIWDEVEIGPGCSLEECIVTDRVRVPPATACVRSVIYLENGSVRIAPFEVE